MRANSGEVKKALDRVVGGIVQAQEEEATGKRAQVGCTAAAIQAIPPGLHIF